MANKPIALDLFCGAGGMSEGLLQAGFDIVFSNDINPQVKETYTTRHTHHGHIEGINTHFECLDIRELTGEHIRSSIHNLKNYKERANLTIDAIFGGPPCQGFSRAGLRNADDPRNMLFKEYLRIIHEVEPNYVVMENVEGILDTKLNNFISYDGEQYEDTTFVLDILKHEFQKIGYAVVEPRILNARDYGVPQTRKRLILMAYKNHLVAPTYPLPCEHATTVSDAFEGLNGEPIKGGYAARLHAGNPLTYENIDASNHKPAIVERFSLFNPGESQMAARVRITSNGVDLNGCPNLVELLQATYYPTETVQEIIELMKQPNLPQGAVDILLTKKNSRKRLSLDAPSPTILTSSDDYIHPIENRSLTVREMARIQSFPDTFIFYGKRATGGSQRKTDAPQLTQVGNAVPPLLALQIANEIIKAINRN